MARKFAKPIYSAGENSKEETTIMEKLQEMAQDILDLQKAVASSDKNSENAEDSMVQQGMDKNSTQNINQSQQQYQSQQQNKAVSSSQQDFTQKMQELSALRYELSQELENGLQSLQQVMEQSQTLVAEMEQLLQQKSQ